MSSISSQIAASVTQVTVQQRQSAKTKAATDSHEEQQAQRLKKQLDQHLHEVEDTTAADSQVVHIHEEDRRQQQERRRKQHAQETAETTKDPPKPVEGCHLDILA